MNDKKSKKLILDRIKERYGLKNNAELARFLGVRPNTISNWYTRNTIDYDIVLSKCESNDYGWIINGAISGNTKAEIIPMEELNDNERKGFEEFTQNESHMRAMLRGCSLSVVLSRLIKESGSNYFDDKYELLRSDIDFINLWLKHYSILEKFMQPYDDFVEGKISYQELLSLFKRISKIEQELFSILQPYMETIEELHDAISKFNNEHDRLFSFEDIYPELC